MGGGSAGGSNGAGTTRALTGAERAQTFSAGQNALSGYMPQGSAGSYQAPTFQSGQVYDPGAAQQLSGGDYDALQQSIMAGRMAPLKEAYGLAVEQNDADMARRGIWSSGAATKGLIDTQSKFGTLMNQAAGEASAQRYGLQSQDLNALNQYNLGRSGQLSQGSMNNASNANQFNLGNAAAQYSSAWQPANYAANVWNGTTGTVGAQNSSGSGGWNFMI